MPSGGANKGKSALLDWLRAHVDYDGDGCLTWPFSTNEKGYGQVKYDDRIQKAHRVMCIFANGEPPEPRYHAAHSCHNGHLGCVHPKHLDWKTPSQNTREAVEQNGGKIAGYRRLTIDQVEVIRTSGRKHGDLAAEFGVAINTIGKICRGEIWSNPRSRYTREQILRIKQLSESGERVSDIAREVGAGYHSVWKMIETGAFRGIE